TRAPPACRRAGGLPRGLPADAGVRSGGHRPRGRRPHGPDRRATAGAVACMSGVSARSFAAMRTPPPCNLYVHPTSRLAAATRLAGLTSPPVARPKATAGKVRSAMSTEGSIERLQELGMSGYEAKAYIALVAAGEPLNGYEVAKRSGVPRSTV